MQHYRDSIIDVLVPFTIVNMMGTALVIMIMRCAERVLYDSDDSEQLRFRNLYIDTEPLSDTIHESDIIESVTDHGLADELEQPNKSEAISKDITDDDLISKVRELLVMSGISDISCIEVDTSNETGSQASYVSNELAGEQGSLEDMAESLIAVTKKISSSLENAVHIPQDKRLELSNLLKDVPGFISKIIDMDESEFVHGQKSGRNKVPDRQSDYIQEGEFLMNTLESLRK